MRATILAAAAGSGQRTMFGCPSRKLFDLLERDGFRVRDVGDDFAHLFDVADHAAAEGVGNQFLRDDPGRDADRRFPGARPAPPR